MNILFHYGSGALCLLNNFDSLYKLYGATDSIGRWSSSPRSFWFEGQNKFDRVLYRQCSKSSWGNTEYKCALRDKNSHCSTHHVLLLCRRNCSDLGLPGNSDFQEQEVMSENQAHTEPWCSPSLYREDNVDDEYQDNKEIVCRVCVWPRQGNISILSIKVSDDIVFVTPVCYSRSSNSPGIKAWQFSGLSTWHSRNRRKQSE